MDPLTKSNLPKQRFPVNKRKNISKQIKPKQYNQDMSPQPKVIVVGASGYIGKAALQALASRHAGRLAAYAGVRDTSKFDAAIDGIKVVQANMGDKKALAQALRGYDRVFLVVPGHERRTELALNGIEAAKAAGIKFLLVLSVPTSGEKTIFGKQFEPIEKQTKESGIDYAIIRLPLFIDNNYANVGSIKGQATFYDPRDPTKLHTPVAVADAGKAAADILANPTAHVGKTYKLAMPAFSLNDLAAAFSKSLGKEIKHTKVSYEAAKEAFIGMGFPEWQTDGIMEIFHDIDNDSPLTNQADTGDIERITGEKAMTVDEWVEQNAAAFQ